MCQRRNKTVGKERKSWKCRQGIEDQCQWQKKNRWPRVCGWFVDGLEASEVHADVGKHGQVLMTWRLPGLRCFGFSEVSWEDTLGIQLEESCSNHSQLTAGLIRQETKGKSTILCIFSEQFMCVTKYTAHSSSGWCTSVQTCEHWFSSVCHTHSSEQQNEGHINSKKRVQSSKGFHQNVQKTIRNLKNNKQVRKVNQRNRELL